MIYANGYVTVTIDDLIVAIKEVCVTASYRFNLILPTEEHGFAASFPYAEYIYHHSSDVMKSLERFFLEERENYSKLTRVEDHDLLMDEIANLKVKDMSFAGVANPSFAETNFSNISGSWRYWICSYQNNRFFDLSY